MAKQRRPKNNAEGLFFDWCEENGYLATKRGWPDFLCVKSADECFVVEVKPKPSFGLKKTQSFTMEFFKKHGIRCFRWNPEEGLIEV